MHGHPPGHVDDRRLPHRHALVEAQDGVERLFRRGAVAEAVEDPRAVRGVGHRLQRDRPHPLAHPGTTLPTLNQCDCTATPSSPVERSWATRE